MTTRERRPDEREEVVIGQDEANRPFESDARETGDAFLQAADAAIERALSGDARTFLDQNRQLGGQ